MEEGEIYTAALPLPRPALADLFLRAGAVFSPTTTPKTTLQASHPVMMLQPGVLLVSHIGTNTWMNAQDKASQFPTYLRVPFCGGRLRLRIAYDIMAAPQIFTGGYRQVVSEGYYV